MTDPTDGGPSGPRKRRRRRRSGPPRDSGGQSAGQGSGHGGFVGGHGGAQGGAQGGGARRPQRGRRGRPGGQRPSHSRVQVVQAPPEGTPSLDVRGVLQVTDQQHGYLRSAAVDFRAEPTDAIVPRGLITDLGLVPGVELEARAIPNGNGTPCVAEITTINGTAHEVWSKRVAFKDLVAEDPHDRIRLEVEPDEISMRVVDLIAPIGKGQRCLIVAPPKAGKTVLLQKMAHSISTNHPEIHLIVLLVDERPEEVTDMRRNVVGEVVASSSDEPAKQHVEVAEIVLERARRLVESGRDVVILLDSITRLSRAYNTQQRGSGRVLSGGIDARTMEKPRRFFGAARNAVDGGSLTVIGTALVDTGSRMDEVIFQEFKGTGNTEIVMDRSLFERRIFPCIDIAASGTRKEEKLFTADEHQKVTLLRRALASLRAAEAMQLLTERLRKHEGNEGFLRDLTK